MKIGKFKIVKNVKVKQTKLIKTKTGKETCLKEIIVIDQTHSTLIIRMWDKAVIERAVHWVPKKTSKLNYYVKLTYV